MPVAEVYAALGLVPRDVELPESKQEIIDLLAQAPEDAQTYRAIRSLLTSLLDDEAQQ